MSEAAIVKLLTANDNMQAGMIIEALKNSQIPAYKKDLGASSIMNIYTGNSKYGADVMINEDDYQKAVEVLQGMGIELD